MTLKCAILFTLLIVGVFGEDPSTAAPTSSSTTAPPQTSTSTKPPETTTQVPTSSTSVAPDHAAPTSRPSNVEEVTYKVGEGNSTCILAKFRGIVAFQYNDTKTKSDITRYLSIDTNSTVDPKASSCNVSGTHDFSEHQKLVIHAPDQKLILTLTITKDNQSEIYVSDLEIKAHIDADVFPGHPEANTEATYEAHPLKLWAVPEGNYYSCHDDQDNLLGGRLSNVTLILNDLKLEAFRGETADKDNFSKTIHDCKNATNDIVPIAVGCALAALVVIVLIAYFVGRRRSRRSAYQSV